MKITKIKTYPVNIGVGSQLVVKVETNTEHYGWGASGLSGRELAVVGAVDHFRNLLVGRDPRRIGAIWQDLYRGQYFEGGRVLTAAISAIDIALHDIKGKALGVPVYELLGGRQRDYVDCFASFMFASEDELQNKARRAVDRGWKVLRLAPWIMFPEMASVVSNPANPSPPWPGGSRDYARRSVPASRWASTIIIASPPLRPYPSSNVCPRAR